MRLNMDGAVKHMQMALKAGILPEEHNGFDQKESEEAARFILKTAQNRITRKAAIAVDSFTNGNGHLATRIVINNDDMPFLVDSASALLAGLSIAVDRLMHPVMYAQRSTKGDLVTLIPLDGEANAPKESFIYFETERLEAKKRNGLERAMADIMRDVRYAVEDWSQMRDLLLRDAKGVSDPEAAALLDWFAQGRLTLLGHETVSVSKKAMGKRSELFGLSRATQTQLLSDEGRMLAIKILAKKNAAPLILKSKRTSSVHRNVLLDLVIVPVHEKGSLTTLSITAGIWTSAALATSVTELPILRRAYQQILDAHDFSADSHAGKAVAHALTSLPHDLLVTFDQEDLERIALIAVSLMDRPRPRLLSVPSPLGRHRFIFVWIPRDNLSTQLRERVQDMVAKAAHASVISWALSLEDGGLALLRFTLDLPDRAVAIDEAALDKQLHLMLRGWEPAVEGALSAMVDAKAASVMIQRYATQFPANYRSEHDIAEAAADMLALVTMERDHRRVVRLHGNRDDNAQLCLKVYNAGGAMPLSAAVPVMENFGFEVIEQKPTALGDSDATLGYIHDFRLKPLGLLARDTLWRQACILEEALSDVLDGRAENDAFNRLIVVAGLQLHQVIWLRSWFRYLRQTGVAYGLPTVVDALATYPQIARQLVALFEALHDPAFKGARAKAAQHVEEEIRTGLSAVKGIDEDRILRLMLSFILATLRTNAWTQKADEALAFKLDSAAIPSLPKPLPWREIWVYSPRVEGIHLRAGPIARGGLRWSDRRDDFRTEILGLMKAQRVKNAVIVPTGAKGGFYPKHLPNPATNRDAWLAEGTEAYRIFIRSLLSITDNIVQGKVVHPKGVVLRDGQDPYFVVAADKGTASFSDIANALAIERGFWLGDAFASGGSVGYDHKAMGITARGGWLSVQRHFSEMGADIQSEPVSVVGVGDMSGDVFGNGMLLSKAIKLVAAFDHRHIFIDPAPDPGKSWKERDRLYNLPRSSWADYDSKLISKGGGVFSRTEKMIATTPEMRALLGIEETSLEPALLMRAILKADVGLIWFGGIGTYIKDSVQSNSEVGDRANDTLRVDAQELRAKAIGEGANLGVTQAGRIAFALAGGRINTDFIDNSAGVDCSDNEVNIKIALNTDMATGKLSNTARVALLAQMTDDVAKLVLEDNRLQTLALSIAEQGGAGDLRAYIRLIETLEATGRLDRQVEGLASNGDLLRRLPEGKGLTRPELAILLSTAKLTAQDAAEETGLAHDPTFEGDLLAAFPVQMVKKHKAAILGHRLRSEIISTKIANRMVNRLGMLLPFELAEEEGCALHHVVEAFAIAEKLLGMAAIWEALDTADMPEAARLEMFHHFSIEMRANMADLIRNGQKKRGAGQAIADYQAPMRILTTHRLGLLPATTLAQSKELGDRMRAQSVPDSLADDLSRMMQMDGAIGLAALSNHSGVDVRQIGKAFFRLGEAFGIDWAQGEAMRLDPEDPWERLLVAGVARDFQTMRLDFLRRRKAKDPLADVEKWLENNAQASSGLRVITERAKISLHISAAMLAQVAAKARQLLV